MIGLIIVWRKSLKFIFQDRKKLFIIVIVLLIFTLPFIHLTLFTDAVKTRALSTSVFREQSLINAMHKGEYDSFKQLFFDNVLFYSGLLLLKHNSRK